MTDMPEPLPASGPERRILLKALRAYRESCHPPELTPDCPFYTWTANGPACGEQCADLLGQYEVADPQDRIDLGGGLELFRHRGPRRFRPRQGPTAKDRPFDARQVYLSDQDRPHADRHTVALIVELTDLISFPPSHHPDPEERSYDVRAVREQLESRGFDVDSFIRYGISATLPMVIAAYIMLSMMKDDKALRPILEDHPEAKIDADPNWIKFFDESYQADTGNVTTGHREKVGYVLRGFVDRVRSWLLYASVDDIVAWRAPVAQSEPYTPVDSPDEMTEKRAKALWVADRFTKIYVGDWEISSLHMEWLYLHGHIPSPCSTAAMAERRIDAVEISTAIADEATENWRRETSGERRSRARDFISVASGHLRSGRPELAAAIFEALTYVDPNDAEAVNNYGFCLIPIDPAAAFKVLERANRLYKGTNLVCMANLVLVLHLTGRNDDAYSLAVSEATRAVPSERGWMWLVAEDDRLELSNDSIDLQEYVKDLIAHIDKDCTQRPRPAKG